MIMASRKLMLPVMRMMYDVCDARFNEFRR
jgi:hypothetical protein